MRRSYVFETLMFLVVVATLVVVVDVGVHLGNVDTRDVLRAVLLSGAAACALIEAAKRLLPLRASFNRRETNAWMRHRTVPSMGNYPEDPREPAILGLDRALQAPDVWHALPWDLLNRWRIVRDEALSAYNLPAEQFVAQISIAADKAVLHRRDYEWVESVARIPLYAAFYEDRDAGRTNESWYGEEIAFALDQLQNRLATRWRFRVQLASVSVSGAVAAVSVLATDTTHSGAYVLAALLFGGFVAWVVRDATASLERFRR